MEQRIITADARDITLLLAQDPFSKICIMGQQGEGKTLIATILGIMKASIFDLKIMANYHVNYYNPVLGDDSFEFLERPDQLRKNKNCLLLWDEMQNDMDSRSFKDNAMITEYLTIGRKNGLLMVGTTQYFDQIDLRGRRIFRLIIQMEKMYGSTQDEDLYCLHFFKNNGQENWEDIAENGYITTKYLPHVFVKEFFDVYDTLEHPLSFTKLKK